MRITSKILSIVYGVSAIVTFFVLVAFSGLIVVDSLLDFVTNHLMVIIKPGEGTDSTALIMYIIEVAFGVIGSFVISGVVLLIAVLMLVAGIVSLLGARNKARGKTHLLQMVIGTIVGSYGIIAAGIFGYIADQKEKQEEATQQE